MLATHDSTVELLSDAVTVLDTVVRLVSAHQLVADRVSVDDHALISIDHPVEFGRWATALGVEEFTAWRKDEDTVVLHVRSRVEYIEVTVLGEVADLPGVSTRHQRFLVAVLTTTTTLAEALGGAA
ncbi:hypothetical protein [Actinokineospora enzanensis]|uniref:hypothetical protein n=1 Tax=Actinokineospora enzanensis TaxID=155975 RepID=UPI00036231E1|nr:hypothetical protein [Actinokineospora enzanensis]